MHIYAVFLPSAPVAVAAEQAQFVRQGFGWTAFLATPLWALSRRYWLALALWFAWTIFVALASHAANLETAAAIALYALGALAFGLEADRFRQARLGQDGYLLRGLAIGDSLQDAESLFFARRPELVQLNRRTEAPTKPVVTRPANPASAAAKNDADLLGLFPTQESRN